MADRIHPADSSGEFHTGTDSSGEFHRGGAPGKPPVPVFDSDADDGARSEATAPDEPLIHPPFTARPPHQPPQGTYVVQLPKDQIYRLPPPENASKARMYARRAARRRRCNGCCFLAVIASILAVLAVLAAVAAGVIYFVFHPKVPKYYVTSVSIKSFDLAARRPFSTEFDVAVRAENPNSKIGIYYRGGSAVNVYYSGVDLANGVWPAFYQEKRNVTVFQMALTGSGILLSSSMRAALTAEEKRGEVPLSINVKVPVKVKLGAVTTPKFIVRVLCDVTVSNMTANASIVSRKCRFKVKL